jgi:hypothetical protein
VRDVDVNASSSTFIDEFINAAFNEPPALTKRPGCPNGFTWRGESFRIVELLREWHDFTRRGRFAHNMRPSNAEKTLGRGSWGVARDHYRVRTECGRVFDIYYDRVPRDANDRRGSWVLFREILSGTDS